MTKNKLYLLTACFLALVLVSWWAAGRSNRALENLDNKKFLKWENSEFVDITNLETVESRLHELINENGSDLSNFQREQLLGSYLRFVQAYSSGLFENFYAFRFPVPPSDSDGNWNDQTLKNLARMLSEPSRDSFTPEEALRILEGGWEAASKALEANPKLQHPPCVNCWNQVAPSEFRISITNYSNLSIPTIDAFVRSDTDKVITKTTVDPIFMYNPTPEMITIKHKLVSFAYIRIVVRTRYVETPYPVYLSMFWSPDYNCWLPIQFSIGSGGRSEESYLF